LVRLQWLEILAYQFTITMHYYRDKKARATKREDYLQAVITASNLNTASLSLSAIS
jgi:hypothetical protein